MLNTLPRRATQVSVHPPLSQIRIGAVAVMVRDGVMRLQARPNRKDSPTVYFETISSSSGSTLHGTQRSRMKRLAYAFVLVLLGGGVWAAVDNFRVRHPVSGREI